VKAVPAEYSIDMLFPDPESPEKYFDHVYGLFKRGQQWSGYTPEFFFQIDGFTIRLVFAGDSLYPAITAVFAHLRINPVPDVDLTVCCWDSLSTSTPAPWLPKLKKAIGKENDITYFNDEAIYLSFNHVSGVLNLFRVREKIGLFWINRHTDLPLYEKASALKNVLNWFFYQRRFYMLHSAAVGINDRGVLIGGKGRTGKSTTAMACFRYGMKYAGDDYIMLAKNKGYRAYSVYNSIKLEENNIFRLFKLRPDMYTVDSFYKKNVMYLNDMNKAGISTGFTICALLLPRIQTDTKPGLKRISPAQAFREMAPSSIFQQMGPKTGVFRFIAEMTRILPCYQLTLSADINRIAKIIERLIEGS
jgi:hypothetical protein